MRGIASGCFKAFAGERVPALTDLAAEIKKILDEHRDRFRLEPLSFPNEEMEQAGLKREREFWLMTEYLTAAMGEEDVEGLKQRIADKLAYRSLQRIGRNDWWWIPADDPVASTLRDVQRALEKSTAKKLRNWIRKSRWLWQAFVELVYLAIVFSLFSVAT